MTTRQVYQYLLKYLETHPNWINSWFLNTVRNKDARDTEGNVPATGEVAKQDWGPFKPVPNIRGIEVHLGAVNTLMSALGIETKFKPSFAYREYVNTGMNKYFNYQIYRLRKLALTNPKEYFKLAFRLMKKSKVMFVIGLNHVEPKWHRDFKLWYIKRLYREYVQISMSGKWKAIYKRTYIPKGEKVRPLGVPELSWRIHNHQLGNIISMYLECREYFNSETGKDQCGFRTGRGCKTAWEIILSKVEKANWVYEFDLSRCFSNIHIKAVSKALRKAQVPEGLISKLEILNLSPVVNPEKLRTDTKETNEWNKWIGTNPGIDSIREAQRKRNEGKEVLNDRWSWWEHKCVTEGISIDNTGATCKIEKLEPINRSMVATKWALEMEDIKGTEYLNVLDDPAWKSEHNVFYKDKIGDKKRGLPQGLPTSPILTISALQECFIKKSKWDTLMYADDGLIYGNGPPPSEEEIISSISNDKYGISVNKDKSRFAKLPGQEMNLKFLGMRLKGDTLAAETRNGSVLKYDKHDLVAVYDLLENWHTSYESEFGEGKNYSAPGRSPLEIEENLTDEFYVDSFFLWDKRSTRTSFEKLASSRLFGLIQSRMYSGDWNQDIIQCFDLKYVSESWSDLYLTTKLKLQSPLGESLNVFNSTSIACHSLLNVLSSQAEIKRHYKKPKPAPTIKKTPPKEKSSLEHYEEYMSSMISYAKTHNSTKLYDALYKS